MRRWLPSGRLAWLLAAALLALTGLAGHFEAASRLAPEALEPRPGPLVLDRSGRVLRLVPEAQGGKLVTLPEGAVPKLVGEAFVAAEDQRFWRHPGIDPLAILRAAMSNLRSGRIVSGASTITQQLARLAYPGPRSYYRKLVEVCRSLRLEAALSKDEILRRYLDRVPLGNNLMGVEAGAWAYFGKTASQLNAAEAATLAALVKAPGALNPYGPHRDRLLARQRRVLNRMAQLGFLSPQDLQARQSEPVRFRGNGPRPPAFPFEAPHFVNLVLARERQAAPGSQRLRTTLDLPLQRRAQAIVASHRVRLLKAGASQAAAVIVANAPGKSWPWWAPAPMAPGTRASTMAPPPGARRVPRSNRFSMPWPWTRGSRPPRCWKTWNSATAPPGASLSRPISIGFPTAPFLSGRPWAIP